MNIIELEDAIRDAISEAKDEENEASLSGLPCHAYADLIRLFKESLEEVRFLQKHEHEWAEDGFCIHCNYDGQA